MNIESFLIGGLASLLATWLFWKYQTQVLPKVTLSDDISVKKSDNGALVFRFKVINSGKNQVVRISLNAWLTELVPRGGIDVSRAIEHFPIKNTATLTLSSRDKEERPWGLTCEMTASFEADNDLLKTLNDKNKKIVATLRASDALSGSTVIIQKSFDKSNLIFGEFKAYQSLVVFPDNN